MLATATAAADTTVVEAESMQWSSQAGHVYNDGAASGGGGFQNWANSSGSEAITLPLAPTGLTIRLRTAQRSVGALPCQGNPEVAVKIGNTTVLDKTVAPGNAYSDQVVDVRRIPAGTYPIQAGLRNDDPGAGLFACERTIYIDKITITASRLFSPLSWRNQQLAPGAALDANQSAVGRLEEQLATHPAWVNTRDWSAPIYIASATQRRVRVQVETDFEHDLWRDWGDVPL